MRRATLFLMLSAAAAFVCGGETVQAQIRHHRIHAKHPAYPSNYYQLPFSGYLDPGTVEILRPRCDDSYPMAESMPCDTATGGPVGGRGS